MSETARDDSSPNPQFDAVLADYLRRVAGGETMDRERFIAEHPDVAGELRKYFETADLIKQLAAPAARLDDAPFDRDAATLPPSSLAGVGVPPTDATPELSNSGPQRFNPSTPQPSSTRIRYFGDYEILEEIARGGMGVVYKARQVSLNRIVAVKMILAGQLAGPDDVRRFRTEAEAAAQLQHPNIVAIHEVGEHEGQQYFSMDYVEGTSLAALVRENPLPAKQAAAIVKTVAEAIHYAHKKGILHRDLKPSNILLQLDRTEGNKGNEESPKSPPDRASSPRSSGPSLPSFPSVQSLIPKITDFGLAKKIEGGSELTGTGQILGTPSYMPPEQAGAKRGEIGPASDVYSLGAILYELITGRPPFRAETPLDTLLQVLEQQPVSPRLLNATVPVDVETICLKCLQKESRSRYATSQELADDLHRYLGGEPIQARPVSATERFLKWVIRRPAVSALIGVTVWLVLNVVAVALGAAYYGTAELVVQASLMGVLVGSIGGLCIGILSGCIVGAVAGRRGVRIRAAESGALWGAVSGTSSGLFGGSLGALLSTGASIAAGSGQGSEVAAVRAALWLTAGASVLGATGGGILAANGVRLLGSPIGDAGRHPRDTSGLAAARATILWSRAVRVIHRATVWALVTVAAYNLATVTGTANLFVVARIRGERFYEGRPISYWLRQLKMGNRWTFFDRLRCNFARPENRECLDALENIGADAVPGLIALLKDDHEAVRTVSAEAIGRVGPQAVAAVPALTDALRDPDSTMKKHAAQALGMIGPGAQPAIPELIRLLASDLPVCHDAAFALTSVGPSSVPHLIKLLEQMAQSEDHNKQVEISYPPPIIAMEIAKTVGDFGPAAKAAIPVLQRLSSPENPHARLFSEALKKITSSDESDALSDEAR